MSVSSAQRKDVGPTQETTVYRLPAPTQESETDIKRRNLAAALFGGIESSSPSDVVDKVKSLMLL